jgi:hypothetical protein
MTFAAIPCIADHEFPNIPDNVFGLRELFDFCALVEVVNEDDGSEVTLRRDLVLDRGLDVWVGDASLEVISDPVRLEASSLCSVA